MAPWVEYRRRNLLFPAKTQHFSYFVFESQWQPLSPNFQSWGPRMMHRLQLWKWGKGDGMLSGKNKFRIQSLRWIPLNVCVSLWSSYDDVWKCSWKMCSRLTQNAGRRRSILKKKEYSFLLLRLASSSVLRKRCARLSGALPTSSTDTQGTQAFLGICPGRRANSLCFCGRCWKCSWKMCTPLA
jgi:hypothetical protein